MSYIITFLLLCCSALFSGLTLGLMSLNAHELKRKMDLKDTYAKKIYPIRKRGNLLLTTLLLGNVAVNSALAIFLGSIATGFLAGLIATGLIFVFGEIVPQAVISRFALAFGAKTAWIVRIMIIILFPLTYPIAWILDRTLGEEMPSVYSRGELLKVIQEHGRSKLSDLDTDEERITLGALTFSNKRVEQIMTPNTVVMCLNEQDKLTPRLISTLRDSGLSRFPVYRENENKIVGVLFLRELLGRDIKGMCIKKFMQKKIHFVQSNIKLNEILNKLLRSHQHMCIVQDEFGGFEGLLTLEDVVEEILGTEIVDEFDRAPNMREYAIKQVKHLKTSRQKTIKKPKTQKVSA